MLRIGSRSYQLVRGQSGFHVALDPNEDESRQQLWRFDAHFVPAEDDSGPEWFWQWEYWRLMINPIAGYRTTDWRALAGMDFNDEENDQVIFYRAVLQNSLGSDPALEEEMPIGDFRVLRREGYLFTCEFNGLLDEPSESEPDRPSIDFRFLEDVPFVSVVVSVPLNAGDPVAAARAIAAREIGLEECAPASVTLFDPDRRVLKPARSGKHSVTLQTPWRKVLDR